MSIEWTCAWRALLLSFLVSAVLVPLARRLALRSGLIDVPNERSSHQTPKPRIGGLAIILASAVGLAVAIATSDHTPSARFIALLLVLLGLAVVGFVDDVRSLSAAVRMSTYLLGAGLAATFGYHVEVLSLWGLTVTLGAVVGIVLTTLFIGWYTNLFNFMDGIDGIAASAAIVTCGSLALVFLRNEALLLSWTSLALAGATAGFLLYNYAPSNVFMGDGGSVFLGAACGSLSIAAMHHGYLSLPATLLLMFPFVYDASFTLVRRALAGERVWQAHRSHIYQQMCDLGLTHREVAITYTVMAAGCAYCGVLFDGWSLWGQALASVSVLVMAFGGAYYVLTKNRGRQRP